MDNTIRIEALNPGNIGDINKTDSFHYVESRLVPHIENGMFGYMIEPVDPPYEKEYEDDKFDYRPYLADPDKTIFLAYLDKEPAGQINLLRNWNCFALVDDIRVGKKFRRNGIGTALMDSAVSWAQKMKMPGIMLETQDVNVPACRFYESYGFILGGVDKKLYSAGRKYTDDTALF